MNKNGGNQRWKILDEKYREDHVMYQDHLQHMNHIITLLNVSLFFVTELVTKHGYYYTIISLLLLGIVQVALVLPFGLMKTLKGYCLFLVIELIALYFFLSSVTYWIVTNRV